MCIRSGSFAKLLRRPLHDFLHCVLLSHRATGLRAYVPQGRLRVASPPHRIRAFIRPCGPVRPCTFCSDRLYLHFCYFHPVVLCSVLCCPMVFSPIVSCGIQTDRHSLVKSAQSYWKTCLPICVRSRVQFPIAVVSCRVIWQIDRCIVNCVIGRLCMCVCACECGSKITCRR